MRTALITLCLALLLPAGAHAGGFATAGVLNPPAGVEPGEVWPARVEILQHGRTPMTGVKPAVIVKGADGRERRFPARKTATAGVYEARVVFPSAGRFDYRVDDGFTNAVPHTFPAVDIRPAAIAAATATADGFPTRTVGAVIGLALLAAGAAGVLGRRRRRTVVA